VGLKLIFLIVTRVLSVLGLCRREAWWKDAEILTLRHQLAVALRERPRVSFEVDVAGPGVAGPARRNADWSSVPPLFWAGRLMPAFGQSSNRPSLCLRHVRRGYH
jgi:hypothetical protein